jgi:hypothetical protein
MKGYLSLLALILLFCLLFIELTEVGSVPSNNLEFHPALQYPVYLTGSQRDEPTVSISEKYCSLDSIFSYGTPNTPTYLRYKNKNNKDTGIIKPPHIEHL